MQQGSFYCWELPEQESLAPSWIKNHGKIISVLYQHDYLTLTEIGKRLDMKKI